MGAVFSRGRVLKGGFSYRLKRDFGLKRRANPAALLISTTEKHSKHFIFGPRTSRRTWGTRPIPWGSAMTQSSQDGFHATTEALISVDP
jgi:hypothetical protein